MSERDCRQGRILFTSSIAGQAPEPFRAAWRQGFEGLMAGEASVFAGSLSTKAMGRLSAVMPGALAATAHRLMTEPGSASN